MSPSRPHKALFAFGLFGLAAPFAIGLSFLLPFSQAQAQAPAPAQQPAATQAAAGGPSTFKDLQVLPKDIKKAELKAIMKAQSKALGVDCEHCHKEPNMEADTPKKTIAREMMKMMAELNKKYRSTTNGKVTCWSCHRGEKLPAELPK